MTPCTGQSWFYCVFPHWIYPLKQITIQKAPGTYSCLSNIPYFLGVYMAKIGKMSICDAGYVTVMPCIGQSWLYYVFPHWIPLSNKKIQKAPGTYCYLSNIPYFLGVYMAKIAKMSIFDHSDVTVTLYNGQSWFYCAFSHWIYPLETKKYKKLRRPIAISPIIHTFLGSTWLK